MSTLVITCPVCGLGLSLAQCDPQEGDRNGSVGGHIHMVVSGAVACLNGHRWTASGNFLLTRTP